MNYELAGIGKAGYLKEDYAKNTQLLFITFWGIAHIAHFLRKGDTLDPFVWAALFFAILLTAKPKSAKRLAALTAIQLIYLIKQMPFTDNHLYIMGFINAGLLIAAFQTVILKKDYHLMLTRAVGYVSSAFLIAYFAAAFVKLNSGFFNIDYSCAVTMFYDSASILADYRFLPPALESLLPWFVAGAELSIPLLLIFKKTRYAGIFVLILFHIGISLSPAATALDFTIALFALSIPFLSLEAKKDVALSFQKFSGRWGRFFAHYKYSSSLSVFFLILFVKTASEFISTGVDLYWFFLAPAALLMGGVIIRAIFRDGLFSGLQKGEGPFGRLEVVHYALLFLLILNAASPYLGVKTTGTFTMYSNLQIGNRTSNHFLVDRYLNSMPMDDVVEIISTDHGRLAGFARRGQWITYHELRRTLAGRPERSVDFVRNGEFYSYNPASENSELTRRNLFLHWVMGHRAYDPENAVCLW